MIKVLHRVLSLFFLTVLGKSKSRRDYFEDSRLFHETVIFPWRAMRSACYFCGRKKKIPSRKMSLPYIPRDESLCCSSPVHCPPFQKQIPRNTAALQIVHPNIKTNAPSSPKSKIIHSSSSLQLSPLRCQSF